MHALAQLKRFAITLWLSWLCALSAQSHTFSIDVPSHNDAIVAETATLLETTLRQLFPDALVSINPLQASESQHQLNLRLADAQLAKQLHPDGFEIRRDANAVVITGATPRAVYYGATWFLQHYLGVMWLFEGELGLSLPDAPEWRLPKEPQRINPSFTDRYLWHYKEHATWARNNRLGGHHTYQHALNRLINRDLQAASPHWIAYVYGRYLTYSGHRGAQPHLLAEGFAEFIASHVQSQFAQAPERRSVSIATLDSMTFDQRPESLSWVSPYNYFRGRPIYSNLVFAYSNAVAEIVFGAVPYEPDPERVITQLAYYWAEAVPDVKLHPRVMPWLTSDRAQWFDAEWKARDKALMQRWTLSGAARVGTWDYYEGRPYLIPRHYPGIIAESLRFLHDEGVHSFMAEGRPAIGFDEPKRWLAAQLLWDIDQDPEALQDSYFTRCYGKAAEPMRAFFDRCEHIWMQQSEPARWLKFFRSPAQLDYFPPHTCVELKLLLSEALALEPEGIHHERIQRTMTAMTRTQTLSEHYQLWKQLASLPVSSPSAQRGFYYSQERLEPYFRREWRRSVPLLRLLRADPSHRDASRQLPLTPIYVENFSKPFLPGDTGGWHAATHPGWFVESAGQAELTLSALHSEDLSMRRIANEHASYLELTGMMRSSLLKTTPVQFGQQFIALAQVDAKVTADKIVSLEGSWFTEDGERVGRLELDMLPVGEHIGIPLTLALTVPEDATTLELRFRVNDQYPGDYVKLYQFGLFIGTANEPRVAQETQPAERVDTSATN